VKVDNCIVIIVDVLLVDADVILPVLCCIIILILPDNTCCTTHVILPNIKVLDILTTLSNCNTKIIELVGNPESNLAITE
jgi:hypothetical protein